MEDLLRTFDLSMRLARQERLRKWATAADALLVDRGGGYRAMVSGSLSRGQVHPWSDLDLVLEETESITEDQIIARNELRYDLYARLDTDAVDVVFIDEIFPGLAKGMLGSLVRPEDIPPLTDLPDPTVALARVRVSIGYALAASDEILAEYLRNAEKLRAVMSDFESAAYSNAMDPLRRKAQFWARKLAVFVDGGRSEWLDDWDDEDALDRLLERLATPGSAPDGTSSVIDKSAAGALRYLLVDAYDFVVRRRSSETPEVEFRSVADAIREMGDGFLRLAPEAETHGLLSVR